jgi:ketosteroid isomerase-like protein
MVEPNTDAVAEITELVQRLAAAWVQGNRAFIEGVLAPEWSVTDPSGRVLAKQQVVDETFSSDDRHIESMTVDDVKVRLFGAVAVATGRTRATGSYKGERASVELRFTDVLLRRDDRWLFVVSQGTLVAS